MKKMGFQRHGSGDDEEEVLEWGELTLRYMEKLMRIVL